MRRIEIKDRGSVLPCRIFNYLGEGGNEIFCKNDLGRVYVFNKKLVDIRFLDPPEEHEIGSHGIKYLARKVGELEDKLSKLSTGLDKVYKELSEEIEKLSARASSELTDLDMEELKKKVDTLELDNKAFKNAFANLGVPVHPACVQERTYTEGEIKDAFDCYNIDDANRESRLRMLLSSLRINREGK